MSESMQTPAPSPENSFRPEDFAFIENFHATLVEVCSTKPAGQDRNLALFQHIQAGYDQVGTFERAGHDTTVVKTVLLAEQMGVGPHRVDAEGAIAQLHKSDLLTPDELRQVNSTVHTLWDLRARGVPKRSSIADLRRHVDKTLSFPHTHGTDFELVLRGLLAGAAIDMPFLRQEVALRAVLKEKVGSGV